MTTKYQRICREDRRRQRKLDIDNWKQCLRSLGFASYSDYLASDLWASIRRQVFERDGFKCRGCGSMAMQAHHRDYSDCVMRGERIAPIVSMCLRCHKKVEFRDDGGKRTDYAAEIICRNLLKKRRGKQSP